MKVDGHLLIDLKNGDEKAFETLFWKYNEHVYHFIYSLLYEKSMAEDLTQNVFLKIWEKHETIDVEQNFDAYLFTIARNLVYKETENRLLSEKPDGKPTTATIRCRFSYGRTNRRRVFTGIY